MNASQTNAATFRLASPRDEAAVHAFLTTAGLPLDGVHETLPCFVVAEDAGEIVGVAGIEACGVQGEHALLALGGRRAIVAEARPRPRTGDADHRRGGGARRHGALSAHTTAEGYFPNFGFTLTSRDAVPDDVRATAEFRARVRRAQTVMVRRATSRGDITRARLNTMDSSSGTG